MKRILMICLLYSSTGLMAQTVKTIKPKPSKAIVYLSGVELSYSENLSLPAGSSEIIVEGVAAGADENSISAFFKGALVIDTKKGVRYPEAPKVFDLDQKYASLISRINDSLEDLSWLMKDCKNKQSALQREKTLLFNNRLMRGEFAKDSIGLLKSTLDLLRTRLNNIDEEELALEKKESLHNKLQQKLNERKQFLTLLQNNNNSGIHTEQYQPVHQIIITIESESALNSTLSLKYYVASAGWMPRYDILAGSGKESLKLVHRAQVYQNTGLDWKDISLSLSTSNPSVGNTKPQLNAWNLFFGYPDSYSELVNKKKQGGFYNYNQYAPKLKSSEANASDKEIRTDEIQPVLEPVFTMGDNFLRTEYEIKTRYSIHSDNKAHNVIVSNTEVPVSLTYMSVPKLDRDAFLMGKIANWEDLNLLPASARIYFDESYIGMTAIEPETTKDTLYINLGRDRSIIIKRIALKEKCKEQVLTDMKIVTKTFEITVRNTKAITLDFEIEDQIPITSDNSIKITLLGKDGALFNEVTGKLTWKTQIKSKESRKFIFSYEIRYPKDKYIHGI